MHLIALVQIFDNYNLRLQFGKKCLWQRCCLPTRTKLFLFTCSIHVQ